MTDVTHKITSGAADNIQTDMEEVRISPDVNLAPDEQGDPIEVEAIEAVEEVSTLNYDTPPDTEDETSTENERVRQSWKELREEGRRTKVERDEAIRLLKMIDENNRRNQPQNKKEEDNFDINSLSDEEYSDNKVLKKVIRQQQSEYKRLKEDVSHNLQVSYQRDVEHRLNSRYPDYESIVTNDNLERLKYERPSMFKSISHNPDVYDQAVSAYEAIRDFGIYKPKTFSREDSQMAKNKGKPKQSPVIPPKKKDSSLDRIDSYGNPTQREQDELFEDTKRKAGWGVY